MIFSKMPPVKWKPPKTAYTRSIPVRRLACRMMLTIPNARSR
jgi:hypothetical protein